MTSESQAQIPTETELATSSFQHADVHLIYQHFSFLLHVTCLLTLYDQFKNLFKKKHVNINIKMLLLWFMRVTKV